MTLGRDLFPVRSTTTSQDSSPPGLKFIHFRDITHLPSLKNSTADDDCRPGISHSAFALSSAQREMNIIAIFFVFWFIQNKANYRFSEFSLEEYPQSLRFSSAIAKFDFHKSTFLLSLSLFL